jgi:hypothetical protein
VEIQASRKSSLLPFCMRAIIPVCLLSKAPSATCLSMIFTASRDRRQLIMLMTCMNKESEHLASEVDKSFAQLQLLVSDLIQ